MGHEAREVAVRRRGPAPGTPPGIPLEVSLPKASFVSETEFRRERDMIIFADWFCVGRADSLTEAGDFLTADVVGESVIVGPAGSWPCVGAMRIASAGEFVVATLGPR